MALQRTVLAYCGLRLSCWCAAGFAGEVFRRATAAYTAATPPASVVAAPAATGTLATGSPSECSRVSTAPRSISGPIAEGALRGGAGPDTGWEGGSRDALLFIQSGGAPPWRVRISVVVPHCEVAMPASTPSPYPDLPLSHFAGVGLLWRERWRGLPLQPAPTFSKHSGGPPFIQRPQCYSPSPLPDYYWNRLASTAQETLTGPTAAFRGLDLAGLNPQSPSVLLEAPMAAAPPLFVVSASLSASYYAECRSLTNSNEAPLCSAAVEVPGGSETIVVEPLILQQTNRLLASVQQMHAVLLQFQGDQHECEAVSHFAEWATRLNLPPEPELQARQRRGGCLRPAGFSIPDICPLTLLDIQPLWADANRKTDVEGTSPGSACASEALVVNPNSQIATIKHSMEAGRKTRRAPIKRCILQRQTLIDGCRCRLKASYTLVQSPCNTKDIVPEGHLLHPSPDSMPDEAGTRYRYGEGASSIRHRCSQSNPLRKGNNDKSTVNVLLELDPLIVRRRPPHWRIEHVDGCGFYLQCI